MTIPLLEVYDVAKRYEPPGIALRPFIRMASRHPVDALKEVSLTVERGEIVGLVGPNGAGKTTLIKIIGTLLEPSRGLVSVDGFDTSLQSWEVRRRLGLVLPDERGLYWRLSGRHNLEFFGVLHGLSTRAARARAIELLDVVGLPNSDKLVFGYSSGMRARLSIARALMTEPPLLVLDEPTRSLDPVMSDEIASLLRSQAESGRGILMSSHRLDEVAAICDRVVVLSGGRVLYSGPVPDEAAGGSSLRAMLTETVAG